MNTASVIQDWLQTRIEWLRSGKTTMREIELDYYNEFFEVNGDILETIWIKFMEGVYDERSRMGN